MTNETLGCIITGGVCLLLLAIALVLLRGRGAMLIAGYNTMSPAKREKYDEKALGRFVGWLLIAMIPCILLTNAAAHYDLGWLVGGSVAASIALLVGGAVYTNTGKRFLREE
ncbi:MAG: DUF3784 domain-containing protein [Oscillospiraceae bacterium]|nr:DUF3784 domain-containing protein [Oscillospiraceae bacterium]